MYGELASDDPGQRILRVPFRPVEGVVLQRCFLNAAAAAGRHGGRAVYGWRVADEPLYRQLQHHAVWEDADGQLWEVTPWYMKFEGDKEIVLDRDSRFIPDADADPERVGVLPNRYVPRVPRAADPCIHLSRADAALEAGRTEQAVYWNRRANQFFHKHGVHVELPGVVTDPSVADWTYHLPA